MTQSTYSPGKHSALSYRPQTSNPTFFERPRDTTTPDAQKFKTAHLFAPCTHSPAQTMPPYDSDSSGDEDSEFTETNVLLGYASKEPTDDNFSQLGGHPVPYPTSS